MENRWYGTPFYYPVNPDARLISKEAWRVADDTAGDIISRIHPTVDSEERRRSVTQYVDNLISSCVKCEVYPYGSVPLKTYLPDGDIDLTVISDVDDDGSLARSVVYVLQNEELKQNAQYQVRHIIFIDAEVKLVKCLVDNVVVDISFNQLGGLCALSFLEQIDRAIGQDHLLKRSIILIKAWCYFESRILGAHHGLISTYALEMLVLHVINRYNLAFNGPLEVLYRFMDYFSKFDWETYCISLNGAASRSSLPDIAVKKPQNGGTEFLLSEEFLRNCVEIFSVPSNGNVEAKSRAFSQRDLNIIDPLKENNNLGRSVCKGNYHRICHAFRFGARQLSTVLQLPLDEIGDEIETIFSNTLRKHGPRPGLEFRVDDISILSNSAKTQIVPEDEEFLEMVKAHHDDEDMEEFKDLLTLRRTDEEIKYTTRGKTRVLDTDDEGECSNQLLDLTGDFDTNLRNLMYAQWCTGATTSLKVLPRQHTPPVWGPGPHGYSYGSAFGPLPQWGPNTHVNSSQWGTNPRMNSSDSSAESSPRQQGLNPHAKTWEGSCVGSPQQRGLNPHMNSNCYFVGPTAYVARSSPSPASFGSEQRPKTRGTGTFIPNPTKIYQKTVVSVRPPMGSSTSNNTPIVINGPEMQNSERQQQPAIDKKDGNAEEKIFDLKNDEFPPLR